MFYCLSGLVVNCDASRRHRRLGAGTESSTAVIQSAGSAVIESGWTDESYFWGKNDSERERERDSHPFVLPVEGVCQEHHDSGVGERDS